MPVPSLASRTKDYANHSATQPTIPHDGDSLNVDFDALFQDTASILTWVRETIADDGSIKVAALATFQADLDAAVTAAQAAAATATDEAADAAASEAIAKAEAAQAASDSAAAATSASNAATSQTAAAASASAAAASESSVATDAATASAAASSASTDAATASAAATAAATSETNAAASASTASSAAVTAANLEASMLTLYDSFDDRYLGAKATEPTVDNDGDPLVAGQLFFDTTAGYMKVYDGAAWWAAYVPSADALMKANNLSDVSSASIALANLGGVSLTGNQTITGAKTFDGVTDFQNDVRITGADTSNRIIRYMTNGSDRFASYVLGAETGGNAGSDFRIIRYDDAGSWLGTPITITRSNGVVAFESALYAGGPIYGDDYVLVESDGTSNATFRNRRTDTGVLWEIRLNVGDNSWRLYSFDGATWRKPIEIEATAPDNSLVIAADGGVLLGDSLQYAHARQLADSTDLDTITTPGWYDINNAVNRPSVAASWGYLEVQRHSNSADYVLQIYTNLTSDNRRWMRRNQGAWGAWTEIQNSETTGKKTIWIPASAMRPNDASPATRGTYVQGSNLFHVFDTMDFDGSVDNFAHAEFILPGSFDGITTFEARFVWTATSGSGTVYWQIRTRGFQNDEAISGGYASATGATDTLTAANDIHISDWMTGISRNGSAPGDLLAMRIGRDVSEDTLAATAQLIGIELRYTSKHWDD